MTDAERIEAKLDELLTESRLQRQAYERLASEVLEMRERDRHVPHPCVLKGDTLLKELGRACREATENGHRGHG